MSVKKTRHQIDKALLDPAAVFDSPLDVVNAAGVEKATKIEILRRWEYDAREIQVEEEESMRVAPSSDLFDRVLEALHQLGAGPELHNTPPTKQGGV